MKNNTHWPYKPGCFLVSTFSDQVNTVLQTVKLPLDQVPGMTEYTLSIPLNFKDTPAVSQLILNGEDTVLDAHFNL